jgi:hypothetical protein
MRMNLLNSLDPDDVAIRAAAFNHLQRLHATNGALTSDLEAGTTEKTTNSPE